MQRGKKVSFMAREGEMLPPAREKGAKSARNAAENGPAREWGIILGAE